MLDSVYHIIKNYFENIFLALKHYFTICVTLKA